MIAGIRFAVLLLLFQFVFITAVCAQPILSDVAIEGSSRVEDDTILLQIDSRAGKAFNAATVDNDVKEIFRTGFFEQVTARLDEFPSRVVLVFVVVEKPALRAVLLQGNDKISNETLAEKLNIESRRFLDKNKVFAGIEQAKQHYQDQGYYGTEIDYSVTPVEGNQVDLTFRVIEGEKKVIEEVLFEGNTQIDDSDLEDAVRTTYYRWWSSWLSGSGVVKKDVLEQDKRELSRFYLNKGYADVRVAEPLVEEFEDGLKVTFKIEEGDIYSFGEVIARGDLLPGGSEETLEGIQTESGDTFGVDTLREDTFAITDKYTDIGYAFANVEPQTSFDRANKLVNIAFFVDQGEIISIDRVNITGNQKTFDRVIRRSLKIHETDTYSSSKVRRSQQLLERLGYFDEVTITTESSERENAVDLNVSVREGQTGSFSAGAGISSGDGFIFNTRITENNLFGRGYNVAFNVDFGTRNENYVISFDNPRVYDTWWSFGLDVLSVEREFDDFDRKQSGGSVTVGYPLSFLGPEYLDDIRFSLRYEFLRIKIDDVEPDAPVLIIDEEGTSTSSSITPRLVRNTINNPLNPTDGSRQSLSVELAGIGGQEEFWLVNASNTIYYPIFETSFGPFVFSQRTRFGYGDTYSGDEDFPLFRRFFPGGINSVRGFDNRELGPKDADGNEFGGSKQLVANFELIFPIFTQLGLKGVGFYDIGNAFDDDDSIDLGELREAFGWGVRWNSPLGPIRVEVGYPIDREDGEDSVVTHFSFGSPL